MWRSKIQKTVSLSTAEAEYYSASEMAIEVLYIRNLLANIGFVQAPDTPVYEDNSACIEWGNHVIGGLERAKHIDIHKHFAHETIQNRQMRLIKVETSSQLRLADIFTKPLQLQQFLACRDGLLTGQRGQALPPRGPCDSGGGKEVAIVAGARMDAADIGLQGIEPRRPFGGVIASKDSSRPEWSQSS